MLILSWNVAGLSTTANRIHESSSSYSHRRTPPPPTTTTAAATTGNAVQKAENSNNNNGDASSSSSNQQQLKRPRRRENTAAAAASSLADYFTRHCADIVCLQEHKIPKKQLRERSEPCRCSTVPGYESFWSCCTDENTKGFNGVVTYARTGTVVRADANPLECPSLDRQGRCVVTDHGNFVLFNVYVPCSSGGGQSLSHKMIFLNALRRAMQRQRNERKKPVVLVGDLNIAHTAMDIYWKDRVVQVDDILAEVDRYNNKNDINSSNSEESASDTAATDSSSLPPARWKMEVAAHWNRIEKVMATKQAIATQTTNTYTKEKFDKFRLAVTINGNNNDADGQTKSTTQKRIYLGKHETSPDMCLHFYDFSASCHRHRHDHRDDEGDDDADAESALDNDETSVAAARARDQEEEEPNNVVRVGILGELMVKIAGLGHWDDVGFLRSIADDSSAAVGVRSTSSPRRWLDAILQQDDMVDVFRHLYPTARARFTCWHQFHNRRYVNDGSRIDYTIVDRALLDRVVQRASETNNGGEQSDGTTRNAALRCCGYVVGDKKQQCPDDDGDGSNDVVADDCFSEGAALCAATANGRFRPAAYEGGGIAEATAAALDTQFDGPPHTGMIYTPPSFSDHIAISLLLKDDDAVDDASSADDHLVLDEKDPATKKAQPHKQQTSISSFFGSGTTARSTTSSSSSSSCLSSSGRHGGKVNINKSVVSKFSTSTTKTPASTSNNNNNGSSIAAKKAAARKKKSFFSPSTTTKSSSSSATSEGQRLEEKNIAAAFGTNGSTTTTKTGVASSSSLRGSSASAVVRAADAAAKVVNAKRRKITSGCSSTATKKKKSNNNNTNTILHHFRKQQQQQQQN